MSLPVGKEFDRVSDISAVDRPDNEISSYRAVSGSAVLAILLGVLSALSFANNWFWMASAGAVVLGILALRAIQRQPEALTGGKMARAGMVLGLVFGISSAVWGYVDNFVLSQRAQTFFQNRLLPVLNERDVNAAIYYREEPEARAGVTPEELRSRIDRKMGVNDPSMFEAQAGPIVKLNRHLELQKDAVLKFRAIEKTGAEGVTPVALGLVEIVWPSEPEHAHSHEEGHEESEEEKAHELFLKERGNFMGVYMKNRRDGRRDSWWVDTYVYPYTPKSFVPSTKPLDDGHGHAPGSH